MEESLHMILAIDIGNTNIVIGCIKDNQILFVERLYTDVKKSVLEYAISVKNVLEIYGVDRKEIEGGIISSVVPPMTGTIYSAAIKVTGKKMLIPACGQLFPHWLHRRPPPPYGKTWWHGMKACLYRPGYRTFCRFSLCPGHGPRRISPSGHCSQLCSQWHPYRRDGQTRVQAKWPLCAA